MPVITAAIAAAGLITAGVGMYEQHQALEKQKQDQQVAANAMSVSAQQMNAAQVSEIGHEQQVQDLNKKQMDMEYTRAQTEMLRNWQKARSMSLATANAQGLGGLHNSSALAGSYGAESGEANRGLLGNTQNYMNATDIFNVNKMINTDKINLANAQTQYQGGQQVYNTVTAQGQASAAEAGGLISLGGSMVSSAGTLGNLFTTGASAAGNMFSFGTGPGSWQNSMGSK